MEQSKRLKWFISMGEWLHTIFLFLGAIVLFFWAVNPLRVWMEEKLGFDHSTIVAITAVVVLTVFSALRELRKSIDAALKVPQSTLITEGVNRVYDLLLQVCAEIKGQHRRLDVLGINLFTAWPQIQGFLDGKRADGWKIRLFCVSPDFIREEASIFDPTWAQTAETNILQFKSYASEKRREFEKRKIALGLFTYRCTPLLHGFRVANKHVFASFLHWGAGEVLRAPFDPYEYFPASDDSERTESYRKLFINWLAKVEKCSVEVVPEEYESSRE